MEIKNKMEILSQAFSERKRPDLVAKVGAVSGLLTAYEMTQSPDLLLKAAEGLAELAIELATAPTLNAEKAMRNRANREGEFAGFYRWLVAQGKSPTTANSYSKALRQVINAKGLQGGLPELGDRLEEMIAAYDGNDQAAHNAHTAALKQYRKFLADEKNKRKGE